MNPRRILIVEDESIVRLHLSRIIEGMGHEFTAEGLAKAMNLIRHSPVVPYTTFDRA